MRARRFVRTALVGVAAVVMVGFLAPPASATSVITVTSVGTLHVAGGLGYPCTDSSPWKPCPPPVLLSPKGGPKGVPVLNLDTFGNTRAVSYGGFTNVCTYTAVNVGKFDKNVVETGPCWITFAGTITGYCGLAHGQASGTVEMGFFQRVEVDFKFQIIGSTMTITGTARKGFWPGWVVGEWIVEPPPHAENSCLSKTATTFTTAGQLDIVIKTFIP